MKALAVASAFLAGALCGDVLGVGLAAVGGMVAAVGTSVLGNDVDRNAGRIGEKVVRVAALLIPRGERQDCIDEWTDDVRSAAEDGRGVRPLLKALGIALIGAPLLAVLVRYDPQRRTR